MALIPVGRLAVATPETMAESVRNPTVARDAVDERIQDVAADIIASDETVVQAAADAVDAALADTGVVTADGDPGDLILRGENGVHTWLQSSRYLDAEGISGPAPASVRALGRAGVPGVVMATPPNDLDLAPGEVRIYWNDGEPVLAVGEDS